jgi:hypothetical protein
MIEPVNSVIQRHRRVLSQPRLQRLLCNEVETADFGNQIVVRHLLSTLFVYVLREWADAASPLADNWFSALRSPHIARATMGPRKRWYGSKLPSPPRT